MKKIILLVVTIMVLFASCGYLFAVNKNMAKTIGEQENRIAKLERDRNSTWSLLGIKQLNNGCENLFMSVKK
jgi:hypothetical protein